MARGAVVAKWAACTAAAVTCLLASTAMMSWKKEGRLELLARAAPRSMLRQQRLWLGENWRIKGLQDDGKYMVPEDPQPETSGNSLFDFGLENGLPIDPESGEPVAGRTEYYARTGTSESHFPREVNQFNIDSIRSNEDGENNCFATCHGGTMMTAIRHILHSGASW
eukprot:755217-Hanusia_phi.AAC.4